MTRHETLPRSSSELERPSSNRGAPLPGRVRVVPGYALLLTDMGISVENVLRRGGVPLDLFSGRHEWMTPQQYFAIWHGLEEEVGGVEFCLRFADDMRVEVFDPLLFAALCSDHFRQAVERMDRFKKLIGVQRIRSQRASGSTSLGIVWPGLRDIPHVVGLFDLLFLVGFCRLATRTKVRPLRMTVRGELPDPDRRRIEAFLGCPLSTRADGDTVVMPDEVMEKPFLTANAAIWSFFEPMLRARLSELDRAATTQERVRAVLLETLPGGRPTLDSVAAKLGATRRSVQRWLQAEDTSFQHVLDATRRELAQYYLGHSRLPHAEIAYLLGFDDPSSFYRVFSTWTGQTPEQHRRGATSLPASPFIRSRGDSLG